MDTFQAPTPAPLDEHAPPQGDLALLLNGILSPINIGMILRVAETFKVGVAIAGSDAVMGNADTMMTVSDFACGALQRKGFARAVDVDAMLPRLEGRRLIATSVEPGAETITDFAFERGDVVLLGNEYDGLPGHVVAQCVRTIRIPMANVWTPKPPSSDPIDPSRSRTVAREGAPNLNVSMAAGIICYQWFVAGKR